MSATPVRVHGCAWCGRIFSKPRSESRMMNGERVCRRPCSLRPLYQRDGDEVGRIRWAGEHVVLTSKQVEALQRLLGKDGQHLIEELGREGPLSGDLTTALQQLAAGFAPPRSPVTFLIAQESESFWSLRFVKPDASPTPRNGGSGSSSPKGNA